MTKLSAALHVLALLVGTHAPRALGSLPQHESSTTLVEESHDLLAPSVLSATTAVLRAVAMTPVPSHIPAPDADASASARRFQAAQASAAALLADNTLEWLLAQSNVADTVRHLLSGDYSATVEARNYDSTAQRPSAADVTRGHGASHTANWTARAAKVSAAPRQKNVARAHEATGLSARAAALGPAVDATGRSSRTAQNHAVAGVWPRRLDEGSGEAQCPAKTAHLQATSEHAQLDCTGGYRNNDHCRWDIQCDQAVAFRLTAIDTEGNFDFVSLYDGGDENAPRLADLSGRGTTSAGTFAAAGGGMLVVFASDDSNVADGFEAEYWCESRESVGCTESSALNYSPSATVDDGSCHCGGDHCGDTAALLQALAIDPAAHSAWAALRGWGADSTDLCDWQGVSCANDRVTALDLGGEEDLKFEITERITKLTKLNLL